MRYALIAQSRLTFELQKPINILHTFEIAQSGFSLAYLNLTVDLRSSKMSDEQDGFDCPVENPGERIALIQAELAAREREALEAIKGDICDWLSRTLNITITVDSFLDILDTGVAVCKLATLIQQAAKDIEMKGRPLKCKVPLSPLSCNSKAKKGTFFARDNTSNFINWCRKLGVEEAVIFESNGLVLHQDEKRVILCLLDVARFADRVGISPPELVRMEKEIEELEARELDDSSQSPHTTTNDDKLQELSLISPQIEHPAIELSKLPEELTSSSDTPSPVPSPTPPEIFQAPSPACSTEPQPTLETAPLPPAEPQPVQEAVTSIPHKLTPITANKSPERIIAPLPTVTPADESQPSPETVMTTHDPRVIAFAEASVESMEQEPTTSDPRPLHPGVVDSQLTPDPLEQQPTQSGPQPGGVPVAESGKSQSPPRGTTALSPRDSPTAESQPILDQQPTQGESQPSPPGDTQATTSHESPPESVEQLTATSDPRPSPPGASPAVVSAEPQPTSDTVTTPPGVTPTDTSQLTTESMDQRTVPSDPQQSIPPRAEPVSESDRSPPSETATTVLPIAVASQPTSGSMDQQTDPSELQQPVPSEAEPVSESDKPPPSEPITTASPIAVGSQPTPEKMDQQPANEPPPVTSSPTVPSQSTPVSPLVTTSPPKSPSKTRPSKIPSPVHTTAKSRSRQPNPTPPTSRKGAAGRSLSPVATRVQRTKRQREEEESGGQEVKRQRNDVAESEAPQRKNESVDEKVRGG